MYTVFISIEKYLDKTKIQENKRLGKEVIQYPSVTVCAENAFKKYLDGIIESGNSSVDEIEYLVKSNTWKKNETFYFLNHKTRSNGGFPCMTEKESNDPGKPCVFPFYSHTKIEESVFETLSGNNHNKLLFNCTYHVSIEPWCYTKVDNMSLEQCKSFYIQYMYLVSSLNHIFSELSTT